MKGKIFNLTFHGIGEPERQLVPGESNYWLTVPAFEDILDIFVNRDDINITFDDGNISDLKIVMPRLLKRNFKAVFFITSGRIDSPGFLSRKDVCVLSEAGMVIGSHGMEDRPWRGLSDFELHKELVAARDNLQQLVKQPVRYAACPFGSYDRRVLKYLRNSGYERVFTSDNLPAVKDAWLQYRFTMRAEFDRKRVQEIFSHKASFLEDVVCRTKLLIKRWR